MAILSFLCLAKPAWMDNKTLEAEGMTAKSAIKVKLERPGQETQIVEVREGDLR